MRRPELSEFKDVAEFEPEVSNLAIKHAYGRLSAMHGSIDFSNNDQAEHERLLIGFNENSFELHVAEEADIPLDFIIKLSRRAFYDILVIADDTNRLR